MCKALGSNPDTKNKNKNKKGITRNQKAFGHEQ